MWLNKLDFLHNKLLAARWKKFLDKPRQSSYHSTEAIYLSSQSVQVNDKKLRVFGVSCLIFRTTCTACLYKTSGFLPIQAETGL